MINRKVVLLLSFSIMLGIFNFPVYGAGSTVKFNNVNLTFDEILYVSVNGSDEDGDGTIDAPFLTPQRAKKQVTGVNSCIYFLHPGEYNGRAIIDDFANRIEDTELTYIANPEYAGQIILNIADLTTTIVIGYKTTFIGLSFLTNNPTYSFDWTETGSRWEYYFYNCAFRNSYNASFIIFYSRRWSESSEIVAFEWVNCSYDTLSNIGWHGTGLLNHRIINIATGGNGWFNRPYDGNVYDPDSQLYIINNHFNAAFDEYFNITSDASLWFGQGEGINPDGSIAHIGVYGGINR